MRIELSDEKILNETVKEGCELVKSLNSENCITADTKLLIVGTITPPQGKGYFYTSQWNRMYLYIDAALGTNLHNLKRSLPASVSEIKQVLSANKIAFLDVLAHCIRDKKSSADRDIAFYSLDYDAFKSLKDIEKLTVICNSRWAEECYNKIKDELFENSAIRLPACIYYPQRGGTKVEWMQAIKDALED